MTRAILCKMTYVQSANFAVGHFCRRGPFQKIKIGLGIFRVALNENVGNGK